MAGCRLTGETLRAHIQSGLLHFCSMILDIAGIEKIPLFSAHIPKKILNCSKRAPNPMIRCRREYFSPMPNAPAAMHDRAF